MESSLAEYIAHSARNDFPDFERPLLAPQPTDLDDKKRKLCEISCSICLSHQNVNPGTFSKTPCKQKGVCGPLSNRLRSVKGPFAAVEEPFAARFGSVCGPFGDRLRPVWGPFASGNYQSAKSKFYIFNFGAGRPRKCPAIEIINSEFLYLAKGV